MKQRRENSDFAAESCSESCLRLSSWNQTDPEVEFVNRSLPSHQNIYDFTFKHTGLDSLCSPVSNSMERNRYYVILSHSSARWHRMTTGGSVGPGAPVSLWVKVMKLPWLDVCERRSNVMLSSLSHTKVHGENHWLYHGRTWRSLFFSSHFPHGLQCRKESF